MDHGFSIQAGDLLFSLSATDEELLEAAAGEVLLPGWRRQPRRPDDLHLRLERRGEAVCLLRDGVELQTASTFAGIRDSLVLLCHHGLARLSRSEVYVHAGVVALRGRALVLPGRSFAGKSTLVRALVEAGAVYYSDEFALFRPDGTVAAFPRDLRLRHPHPERLPAGEAERPPLAGAQVGHLRYDGGAGWSVEPLSPARAALVLLENTVAAQSLGSYALQILSRALAPVGHWHGTRGEVGPAAARILQEW